VLLLLLQLLLLQLLLLPVLLHNRLGKHLIRLEHGLQL
jgi:hypothetical protein